MRTSLAMFPVAVLAALLVQGCGDESAKRAATKEEKVEAAKDTAMEAASVEAAAPAAEAPINEVRSGGRVNNWNVMVFTITTESTRQRDEEYFKEAFDKDYLAPIGGEAKAVIGPDSKVAYKDAAGESMTAEVEARDTNTGHRREIGFVASDWGEELFGRKIVYANCMLESDKDQTVTCLFGSDDEANVFVNGEKVHKTYSPRDVERRQDKFKAEEGAELGDGQDLSEVAELGVRARGLPGKVTHCRNGWIGLPGFAEATTWREGPPEPWRRRVGEEMRSGTR